MCYIFNCFGWALDFLQRTLTFVLACIMCAIVGLGVVVACCAGVAYGYNYSMAEWLTFTRQDTTVYMRRGQFYDKPDWPVDKDVIYMRRSGAGEPEDSNMPNGPQEIHDPNARRSGAKSLPDTWGQVKDTRKYAEVLTKFSRKPDQEEVLLAEEDFELTRATQPPHATAMAEKISIRPNPRVVATTVEERGTSFIIMRNFKPLSTQRFATEKVYEQPSEDVVVSNIRIETLPPYPEPETTRLYIPRPKTSQKPNRAEIDSNAFYSDDQQVRQTKFYDIAPTRTIPLPTPAYVPDNSDTKIDKRPHVPMRHWGGTLAPKRTDTDLDYKEDVDEDNVVYKPI